MSLETDFERVSLPLEFPFTISRGTVETAENVIVRVSDGEFTGLGGAGPSPHYGETVETVEAVLPTLLDIVEEVGEPHQLERIERRMKARVNRNPAARCAISIALHDLVAKRLDLPLYRYWGLDPEELPETSYTIGIDGTERMREKTTVARKRGYSTLKIKLGTDRDEEIIETVREEAPEATIRVDANEAWAPREAVGKIEALAAHDVEFVEQPVPAEDPAGMAFVRERAPLPIAADESCVTLADIPRVAEIADIANVKLMKCGSLREAREMFAAARANGLETMLGCMNESNASIAAACHLAPLLDYADLDGSLLLDEDPYDGVGMPAGGIDLAAVERGTGVR
ncbi:dipeptide epimerase [Halalkalicoccus jeotgali]|uniref:Mandelate racemase/muconate lactonizing protein n=1 Tax=Halalkalicoccus jeotgali (strain DSM 18796 / CECT 7217 / JCM 14584 / KCTC 4019 / B3) TaxID=795797 RepID=D8JAE6_HALJB|nr:dipeptide epimerase [Halalkalicoccus jeotgali]ADJ14668.1 Mandelate racemase/muconate lactonizing protein [Halalkalicoccus jeotgali B3]ELY39566.1 Mandelate racemase/muconate lactonizing protein [Halalkalicoccus jeotgali B3]